MTGVAIAGEGVAARCAAHVLAARGVASGTTAAMTRTAPVVMIGDQARALLGDVFAAHAPLGEALAGAHPITRRVVCWGDGAAQSFPHAGVVIDGATLEQAFPALAPVSQAPVAMTLRAGSGEAMQVWGTREAIGAPVTLAPAADRGAVMVEALAAGWLFLMPRDAGQGWLLAVGCTPEDGLAQSRLIAPAVAMVASATARFETAPRLAHSLVGADWLALGSGAIGFDPVCGDGTAMAVRAGLLAGAVAAAMAGADMPMLDPGVDGAALIGHYRAMLIAAMRRHLAACLPFYQRGGTGAWWQDQAEALARGHAWCTRELAQAGEPRFVLAGDRLLRRDHAA